MHQLAGTDLLTQIIKSFKPNIRISNLLVVLDIIIVALNVIFFKELEIGLYSAIAIYLYGKLVDIFFEGIYFTKEPLEPLVGRLKKECKKGLLKGLLLRNNK